VTGGFVYRGILYPALVGRYFFADYVEGKIWSLYKTDTSPDIWSAPELKLDTGLTISGFGEDETGELYVVGYSDGTVRRLADVEGPSPNLMSSEKRASSPNADPGEVVTYTIILNNVGALSNETAYLTDTVPSGLDYIAGSLAATQGNVDDSQDPVLRWAGPLTPTRQITITYQVTATGYVTGSIVNWAQLVSRDITLLTIANALFVPRSTFTTTHRDFFLPGTQPNQLSTEIPPPIDCNTCHTAPIYDRWRGSMMGQAGRDPLMWAALAIANNDAPAAGDYCLRCHTAKGWLEGRSHPADGSSLQPGDLNAGVACEICHRMVDPIPSETDEATAIDAAIRAALTSTVPISHTGSAMMIVDPQDNRRGPFSLGPSFSYHTAYRTDLLGQSTNSVTESRLCGTCHNVDNPALSWNQARGQFWPNDVDLAAPSFEKGELFPIETTFEEWLHSEYATVGVFAPQFAGEKPDGIVSSCQDCHMYRTAGTAADDAFNSIERDCLTTGCLPEHRFTGGNTWVPRISQDTRWRLHSPIGEAEYLNVTTVHARRMLQKAATLTVTLTTSGADKIATVRVTNQTGHKLPTGYPEGRRMWLNLEAYNDSGALIYESGAYDPSTGILATGPDVKVYEVKQGITPELAGLLGQRPGESFHFILNNTVIKDNRIPPRGFTNAAFDCPGLCPVGTVYADGQYWDETLYVLPGDAEQVFAALYYQTSSKEYIDFLRTNGGVDGNAVGGLWDVSKSPPEIMALAWFPNHACFLPVVIRDASAQ
jgi:uncharacterized repeat protein (TIGR01451 family)